VLHLDLSSFGGKNAFHVDYLLEERAGGTVCSAQRGRDLQPGGNLLFIFHHLNR